ncbi:MAG: AsmA family protein [Gammaproteobacteria bacterium]
MPTKPHLPERRAVRTPEKRRHNPWKITGIVLACIIVVIIILVIVLPFVINPNDFKPEIVRAVHNKTGRELSIPGDIKLSIFPWLGAEIGPMSLSNAPGFGNTPFASINVTDIHVKFWPLLRGRIEVGMVKLDGLNLDLERNAQGQSNWSDIVARLKSGGTSGAEAGRSSAHGLANLQVKGFSLSDSGVTWKDAQKHQQYTFTNINMTMGAFRSGEPVSLSVGFAFSGTNPAVSGHADFKGTLVADLAQKIYDINASRLTLAASGDAVPGRQVKAQLAWQQAALNLQSGTLAVDGLSASAYGLKAQISTEGKGLQSDPSFNGSIKLSPFSPRAVLTALGRQNFVNTRDPKALAQASGSFNFIGTKNSVVLQNLNFKLDDTTITGDAAIKDLKARALTFNLNLDQIDVDRYLPPQKAAAPAQPREATDINKFSIPVRTLRSLNLDGEVHIGQLSLLAAHLSNVSVGLSAHLGVVQVTPLAAELYGGTLAGNIKVDAAGNTPVVTESLSLANIQAGQMLADMFTLKRLSGTANLQTNIRALGPTVGELRHTLSGRLSFALKNGAFDGINVWDSIERAYALVEHQPPPPPGAKRTEFAALHGSGTIHNGVLENHDLVANLPFMNLTGSGKLDLAENTLDYDLRAHITDSPKLGARTDLSGLAGKTIPLKISGTLESPSVRPDIEGAVRARAQTELQNKKQELREQAESELRNKLRSLIQAPAAVTRLPGQEGARASTGC